MGQVLVCIQLIFGCWHQAGVGHIHHELGRFGGIAAVRMQTVQQFENAGRGHEHVHRQHGRAIYGHVLEVVVLCPVCVTGGSWR